MPPKAPAGKTAAIGTGDEPSAFGAYVARPTDSDGVVRTTTRDSPLNRLSVQLAETCSLVDPSRSAISSPVTRRVLTKPSTRAASRCALRQPAAAPQPIARALCRVWRERRTAPSQLLAPPNPPRLGTVLTAQAARQ